MKKRILPALLFAGWLIFLSTDIPVGENFLPSLGRFMNPFEGIWRNVKTQISSKDFHATTKGEVRILFDERDVPHIYAQSIEDAIYAQGYLHAANRLFAMDISTRAAAGRLSEIVGPRTIAIDHQQRERGIEWAAIQKAEGWQNYPDVKQIIDAYVKGVNDYISTLHYHNWPLEYKILSHGPVTWTPKHTALMAMNMAIMLCMAESDLDYTKAKSILSEEDFQYLYPEHNILESPIIPPEKQWDFTPLSASKMEDGHFEKIKTPIPDDKQKDVNGSNNWAVSGKKTASGFPLLANDPHLSLTLPNIWYEMEIHTPEMSVHGVSIPGLPYIVIGFNESVAWGTTNSGLDVLDWYQINWQDSSRKEYLMDGKFERATFRAETINIRGQNDIIDTIRYTRWGPVSTKEDHRDMAMKWIGHAKANSKDVAYLQKINKAKNVDDYREAVAAFQYPAQNKVFASVQGDIAITVAGAMPFRAKDAGRFVMKGDVIKNDWQGFIPFEHAPFIINPQNGYVSSANQSPTDIKYPYPNLGTRIFEDYRGRVINMVLDSSSNLTVQDMMDLQQNNYNLHAAEILPLLLTTLEETGCITDEEKKYARQLSKWNYEYHRDSITPVIFDLWYQEFEKTTFDELDSMGLMHPEDWRIIEIVRDENQKQFFDLVATTDRTETKKDIICASFSSMVKTYQALDPPNRKDWGSYKATEIPHLARFATFGASFMHTSGAKHIVNAMGKSHGPSWRMIVELSNPPKAYVNYPGGQSGDPASPHFRDMLDGYFEGKYFEVGLKKDPSSWTPDREIKIKSR